MLILPLQLALPASPFFNIYRNVPDKYSESLISAGILNQEEVTKLLSDHTDWLNDHFKQGYIL
jgi:hypothetical protein